MPIKIVQLKFTSSRQQQHYHHPIPSSFAAPPPAVMLKCNRASFVLFAVEWPRKAQNPKMSYEKFPLLLLLFRLTLSLSLCLILSLYFLHNEVTTKTTAGGAAQTTQPCPIPIHVHRTHATVLWWCGCLCACGFNLYRAWSLPQPTALFHTPPPPLLSPRDLIVNILNWTPAALFWFSTIIFH